ncbi:ATP-dependent nuclease [Tenuifilum thalassicum]|uniref:AAA family ATPase n=1 Tax=Tenuifilum thalassicum TaxID=2590900 RepID=A0A7D4BKU9_9BACT|nr:AAA family ATPase [Tenuifilum thalassicum]QKG80479.1 AAA family ATPase [Tenuifilum thalassicum]
MYISELKLWNFRKYGQDEWNLEKPHLVVPFNSGTNVLIGENDSGKTAIIDAIKLVLKTHAYEWIKVEKEDFYENSDKLRIEIIFRGLKDEEAKNFTEWLGWEGEGDYAKPVLRLILYVEQKNERILPYEVKAGMGETGYSLNAEARDYLKSTYLKALRDADNELIAKRNSRLSQILQGHELFKKKEGGEKHEFEKWLIETNEKIRNWFNDANSKNGIKSNKEQIKDVIDNFLQAFIDDKIGSELKLSDPEIKAILEKISLEIEGAKNLGLGTMNRLYMAAELLHLKKDWNGLKLALVEELEAHLHPQAQMKVIEALQKERDIQFILTTHSPNLASKVDIQNLIICKDKDVYSLSDDKTKLYKSDYKFLKRFLDVTKSNLFFAKGVIIVEGMSEEIIIPEIAKKLGYDLTKHEVSIVNVGSTAYLHFAKIFLRNDGKELNIPVSVVTDLDVRPIDNGTFEEEKENQRRQCIKESFEAFNDTTVKLLIAKQWTLEWCLYKSKYLSKFFKESVSEVHSGTEEFKKDGDNFKPEFESKFIDKLAKKSGTSSIDKVAIAGVLAEKISVDNTLIISEDDEFIKYIIDAIKHACRIQNGN